jgi:hypothetical protein
MHGKQLPALAGAVNVDVAPPPMPSEQASFFEKIQDPQIKRDAFHASDFAVYARQITLMEDLAFRRLLDYYYATKKPLPLDFKRTALLLGMEEHHVSVGNVLAQFFRKADDGYTPLRVNSRRIQK